MTAGERRIDPPVDRSDRADPEGSGQATMASHWRDLVTTALLGTDRRDPPPPVPELADLVDDTARSAPSERLLAHVAACVSVRRAGVLPGPVLDPLAPPDTDDRPPCPAAGVDRWHHITTSWPVLEDEWTLAVVTNGWRLAPELVAAALGRHRRDPLRHTRVRVAAGPLADWLVGHLPDLATTARRITVDPDALAELPDLPIPPELSSLLSATGVEAGREIGAGLEHGHLGAAHRNVLVNVVARVAPSALTDLANVLDAVDPYSPGAGLASVLGDLATTRHRMLAELTPS
ncbi:MAG: hypothetical protein AAGG08_01830 [Actinomycetota bacterium]